MKITIEHHDNKYICEIFFNIDATELLDYICRLMVDAGYTPKSVENAIVENYHNLDRKDYLHL